MNIPNPTFLALRNYVWRNWRNTVFNPIRGLLHRKVSKLNYPCDYTFNLETVTSCNAKCVFCPHPSLFSTGKLKYQTMPVDMSLAVLKEVRRDGFMEIGLSPVLGDVSTDPHLLTRFQQIKSCGLEFYYTTNGILLKRQYREVVEAAPKILAVSLEGFDAEYYRKIYGVDKYRDVLHGIILAISHNERGGYPTTIQLSVRTSQTFQQLLSSPDYLRYIKPKLGPHLKFEFSAGMLNWGGSVTGLPGNLKMMSLPRQVRKPCHGLRAMRMLVDGRVRVCGCAFKTHPGDDMIAGQYPQQSIRQMAEHSNKLIADFKAGERPEVCKTCTNFSPLHGKLRLF